MRSKLRRFSVSLPEALIEKFDKQIESESYPTRSKAIGDLIRNSLVEHEWDKGDEVSGAVILVYNHHKRQLSSKLTHVQHEYHHVIVSSQHIHMDHHNCMEIIAVKGNARDVKYLVQKMKALKGIGYISLSMATPKL